MRSSEEIIELEDEYGANNYAPLPVVIAKAEGVWVEDPEGNRYIDMLSCYSAISHGHRHPEIIEALKEQADQVIRDGLLKKKYVNSLKKSENRVM